MQNQEARFWNKEVVNMDKYWTDHEEPQICHCGQGEYYKDADVEALLERIIDLSIRKECGKIVDLCNDAMGRSGHEDR